jgi:Mg2+ and Co2+ transporter CorA
MNFKLWPSGEFAHSFWIVLGFMVVITGALAWCFRRWGWF